MKRKQNLIMKTSSLILLVIFFIFSSCKKEDNCPQLSEEQLKFLAYETGDQFKLKSETSGDTIIFNVTEKIIEEVMAKRSFFSVSCLQEAYINFNELSCNGSLSISINEESNLNIYISLLGCYNLTSFSEYIFFGTIKINGKNYENAYLFTSHLHELYFSKEKGFLKIDEISTGKTLYTIIE